jgi:hypothetical protein
MTTEIPAVNSRWLRTDSDNRGKGIHAVVLRTEEGYIGEKPFVRVYYKPEGQRAGSMLLRDFTNPKNFVPAEEVAASEPAQLTLPTVDPNAAPLAQLHQKADLILALLGYKAAA